MEKSYRMWGSDMTPDYTPVRGEPGSLRAHEEGRRSSAARRSRSSSPPACPNRFVTLEVHGVTDADPLGNEPLFDQSGRMIGRATSGYYGHHVKKSLAIGYVKAEFAERRHAAVDPDPRAR